MASSRGKSPDTEPDELLDDLESIRTLLDEEDASSDEPPAAPGAERRRDDEVPMLDDVVDLEDADTPAEPEEMLEPGGNLTDDVFASLMGDGWKEAADGLLEDARHAIDDQAHKWTPEDTDELNEALRVRIDETIYSWLQNMLANNIDALRAQVLDAMSDEIKARVKQAFGDAAQSSGRDSAKD